MKDKRGSHVGVVLSFAIFIAFSIFIYSVLEPSIEVGQQKSTLLNYLKIELVNQMSADLTTATVKITGDNPEDNCVSLENFLERAGMDPPKTIVKNEDNIVQQSGKNPPSGPHLLISRNNQEDVYFKVFHSEVFSLSGNINPCGGTVTEGGYQLGQIKTESFIFESRVSEITSKYDDYELLKDDLDLAGTDNFGFVFTEDEGQQIIASRNAPLSAGVFSEELPVLYVDEQANIKSGYLRIRVW